MYLAYHGFWRHIAFMSDQSKVRGEFRYFAEFEHCRLLMIDLRWPDGKVASRVWFPTRPFILRSRAFGRGVPLISSRAFL